MVALALAAAAPAAHAFLDAGSGRPAAPAAVVESPERTRPQIRWRNSRAVGSPSAGRLVRGVRLPGEAARFFTWDPLLHRVPNRADRRWGTDELVRVVLRVVRAYGRAHPGAPRVGIGDLSRRRGGPFGPKHASHQNGLDVDVYYPRRDRKERPPRRVGQIDRRLAQDLVDRFVRAGAEIVYVGPNTGFTGPRGIVRVLWNHDNHLHVRIGAKTD
jgi:murein endopeptidase